MKRKSILLLTLLFAFMLAACTSQSEQVLQEASDQIAALATENADTVNNAVDQIESLATENADTVNNAVDQVEVLATENADTVNDAVDQVTDQVTDEMAAMSDLGGREVTVAVENAYLPFNYIDLETGEAAGWDYVVIDRLGELLNFTPVYVTTPWEGMIQAVADGQFDVAADGITITEDRAEVVDFSIGYINIDQRMLVRLGEDRFTTIDEFVADEDLQLGTQSGTTNFETASSLLPNSRIQAFDQFGFAIEALLNGDVDAVIIDETAGQGYLGVNADELELLGDSLSSDQLGFIYPQGSELIDAFNQGLQAMIDNGELEEINEQFFSDEFSVTYDDIAFPDSDEDSDE